MYTIPYAASSLNVFLGCTISGRSTNCRWWNIVWWNRKSRISPITPCLLVRASKDGVAKRVSGWFPQIEITKLWPCIYHSCRLHARFPRVVGPRSHAKRVFERAIYALTFRGCILFDTRDFSGDPSNLRGSFFATLILNELRSILITIGTIFCLYLGYISKFLFNDKHQ